MGNVEVDDTGCGSGLNQSLSLFTEARVCNVLRSSLTFSHVNNVTVMVDLRVDERVNGYGMVKEGHRVDTC
jgi:hypothetical protein